MLSIMKLMKKMTETQTITVPVITIQTPGNVTDIPIEEPIN